MPELIIEKPPFKNDAPVWYNNGKWGMLGCAVPQTGEVLYTQNVPIWEFTDVAGRQMFHTLWQYDDRRFESPPSKACLWDIYQLIVIARKRLADRTYGPEENPPLPTHARPAYKMYNLYPIPFFGENCPNSFLNECANLSMLMLTEAMQHSDNERMAYVTPSFALAVSGYLRSMLSTMATKFFGYARKDSEAPDFVIPDDKWKTYNPMLFAVSVEGTSARPAPGWTPTEKDLEEIKGLPAAAVLPFCQQWPVDSLISSPGGIWTPNAGNSGGAKAVSSGFPVPPGPPQ